MNESYNFLEDTKIYHPYWQRKCVFRNEKFESITRDMSKPCPETLRKLGIFLIMGKYTYKVIIVLHKL